MGHDWLSRESSGFMAACHRISVDNLGLFGADIELGVLNEQLPGRWHPDTTPREDGAHEGR